MENWLEETYEVINELNELKNEFLQLSEAYFKTDNNKISQRYFKHAEIVHIQIEKLRKMTCEKVNNDFTNQQQMNKAIMDLILNNSIKG